MTRPEFLALAGILLVISLLGPTMNLFRSPSPARTDAAGATAARPYRYLGPDGAVRELAYDDLPTALGRWTYATQTAPSFTFAFDLEKHGGVVRIYIAEMPPYGARDTGLAVTHRLADGSRHYICIQHGNAPVDGREAATWLIYWAEATAKYILTGTLLVSGPVLFPLPLPLQPDASVAPTITIDAEPWRLYRESIARNPPETVALIGGSLDAPSRITDFYFMPPRRRGDRFAHGAAHIELDHAAMNYVIDRVLVPNGKYLLGLWHSHPGGYSAPSAPDLLLCRAILGNDDSPGRRWPFLIAPITTFDADGVDRVTVWILRKGAATFERAVFEPPMPLPVVPPRPDVPAAAPVPTGEARPDPTAAGPADAPPAPPVESSAAGPIDPLAASALRLGALLAQPDGLVGVPRYRAGGHLHAALRIAESGADREPQP